VGLWFQVYEVALHELSRQVATHSNERAALLAALMERVTVLFEALVPTAHASMTEQFHWLDNHYADAIAQVQRDLYRERVQWHADRRALEDEMEREREEHRKKEAEWRQIQIDYSTYYKASPPAPRCECSQYARPHSCSCSSNRRMRRLST
jgi:hypothetical protein